MHTRKAVPWIKGLALLPFLLALPVASQDFSQTQPAAFLRSNDRFGMKLLSETYKTAPDQNFVIAPLPVSLTFAALLEGSPSRDNKKELISTFQWQGNGDLNIAGRMLHARFAEPNPKPPGYPEEMWISGAFVYRGQGSLTQDFIDQVRSNYGFTFRSVGESTPEADALAGTWDPSLPIPTVGGPNDFWITSFLHLRSYWVGNTFSRSEAEKQDFTLSSGKAVKTDFLKSETESYLYSHSEERDAVALYGWQTSILFVLPGQNVTMSQILSSMVGDPDGVESSLKKQWGDVQMPPFHFTYETDFRPSLEDMGMKSIFQNPLVMLSMAPARLGGVLKGVAQRTEITVDGSGIRADSGTNATGVFGGIFGPPPLPFHLALNRPFLFVVRDRVTHALLFAGVVTNPTIP